MAILWLEYSDGLSKTAVPQGCSRSEKGRETLAEVMRTQDGINFPGYRIFPAHRLLRQTTARRFIRRLRLQSKLYARSLLSWQCIDRSVQSWLGHATHAATYGLRRRVFSAIAFRRTPVPSANSAGEGQAVPGRPARRRLEQ